MKEWKGPDMHRKHLINDVLRTCYDWQGKPFISCTAGSVVVACSHLA
jgi:hypothetical protein